MLLGALGCVDYFQSKMRVGFREMHFFNLAMLVKQLWNIMQKPTSTIYMILKAKYFQRQHILKASVGHNPSYLWRSLLAARELVCNGMAWRIGNGKSVSIRDDKWIGVEPTCKTISNLPDDLKEAMVDSLIDANSKK